MFGKLSHDITICWTCYEAAANGDTFSGDVMEDSTNKCVSFLLSN